MSLNPSQKDEIENLIIDCVRKKLKDYKPESSNMPFHYRLLGKDRMALYSFIHSLNTSFGMSIFEPVAITIAKPFFKKVSSQFKVGDKIYENTQIAIQHIMNELSSGLKTPNLHKELKILRDSVNKGKINKIKTVKADIYLEKHDGEIILIELKSVKPNKSNFKDFKRTLLEWAGIMLTKNKNLKVKPLIALPYNPYKPQHYERWTIKGMLDDSEFLVGKEFWDFLGGDGVYEELLICFENAGKKLRKDLDDYFQNLFRCKLFIQIMFFSQYEL